MEGCLATARSELDNYPVRQDIVGVCKALDFIRTAYSTVGFGLARSEHHRYVVLRGSVGESTG